MRIAYLFMKYPVPVQPFAISDVKALERAGHTVETYALSGRHADHEETATAYGLEFQPCAHPGWRTLAAPLDPRNLDITLHLLMLIIRRLFGRPREFAHALALAPRMIEVASRMRRDPPDVIHAFWGHYPSLLLVLAERFFAVSHRSLFLGAYDLTTHFFSLTPLAARGADSVWTHAEENRAALEAAGAPPERIRVVHRGIPLDLADGPMPPKEPGLVTTAANFQREKNLDLALRAFARLRETVPQARFLLIGDGEVRAELEALSLELSLGDSAVFAGRLTRTELFAEMARSEVFVFLSTKPSERLPNVVKEAMLARCWCVVSRTTGIEELVEDGVTGEISDDLRPESVAALMASALLDPERSERTLRAAERVRERFSSDAAMAAYAEVWCRERGRHARV